MRWVVREALIHMRGMEMEVHAGANIVVEWDWRTLAMSQYTAVTVATADGGASRPGRVQRRRRRDPGDGSVRVEYRGQFVVRERCVARQCRPRSGRESSRYLTR